MKRLGYFLVVGCFALPACTSARLTHDEARKRIAAIGQSNLVPDAIEIRRIISQSDKTAIAEATATLAFQFRRADSNGEWRIEAVRLGDRDWISFDELISAINEARRRQTLAGMQAILDGVAKYQAENGALPQARNIAGLTDVLHPRYMPQLVREDGWGRPIVFDVTGASTFRLLSSGADGRLGTPDDIILEKSRPEGP